MGQRGGDFAALLGRLGPDALEMLRAIDRGDGETASDVLARLLAGRQRVLAIDAAGAASLIH